MSGIAILIFLALIVFIFVFPVMALAAAKSADRRANEAHDRIHELEKKIRALQRNSDGSRDKVVIPEAREEVAQTKPGAEIPVSGTPHPAPPPLHAWQEEEDPIRLAVERIQMRNPGMPPMSEEDRARINESETHEEERVSMQQGGMPAESRDEVPSPAGPAFSIEQFLGVKLFAWLGGVALFFGVIFFVKYAFENNLIPPKMRIALGFSAGLALFVGGLWTHRREKYQVLAQALCATGVLVLYGVSFAAHAVYRFPAFNQGFTFTLMAAVTAAAFLTAVRMNALVVAVLGMLGGFITPVLLPLVQDHPLAFFGYIALLDTGLLALATRGRWPHLATGAVAGTIAMLVQWTARFFVTGNYAIGSATWVPMGILLGFGMLFLAAAGWSARKKTGERPVAGSAYAMLLAVMGFSFYFLFFDPIADRIFLLYGYILLIHIGAIALGVMHPFLARGATVLGAFTLVHLVIWTEEYLKPDMLGSALAVYLAFGALHTLWPVVAERWKLAGGANHEAGSPSEGMTLWLPAVVIALMAIALRTLPEVSLLLWPAILLANVLAITTCVRRGVVLPLLATLTLTMLTAALWLHRMPRDLPSLHTLIGVVMSFALLFTGSGLWLARLFVRRGVASPHAPEKLLPLASAVMPFVLLILMTLRIPLPNPTPVFGAAAALAALMLAVAMLGKLPRMHLAALFSCLLLQWVWHGAHFSTAHPYGALVWYVAFYSAFTVLPFAFRTRCAEHAEPWIASALSGVGHFLLVYYLVLRAFPKSMGDIMGLVPAAFAVPALVILAIEWRRTREMNELEKSRLAWFGGVALLFITLIFPIQYERQWLTIGWALEGAALLWLFRWVPHRGLILTGASLLCAAFARLSLNPFVLLEYERSGTPILNWYLYTYGIVSVALLAGARLMPSGQPGIDDKLIRALLYSLGGILLFLLLNIEIADAFTEPGDRYLAFEFSGNFARDMTYTIGWAVFALATLVIGIVVKAAGARYAGISLLALTLVKLFLHDLANIENVFRIAALLCVGVIAFLASFLYQRFVPAERKG